MRQFESAPQDGLFLRVGLIGAGGVCLYTALIVFASAPAIRVPVDVVLSIGAGLLGFILVVSSGLHRPPSCLRWLILLAFSLEVASNAIVWTQTYSVTETGQTLDPFVQTDSAVYTDTAAKLLLRGRNPYAWDYSGVMALYRVGNVAGTLTLQGANESAYPYPALPIWLTLPFEALHLPGTFCLLLGAYLLTLVLVFVGAPRSVQPLVLLPTAVSVMINLPIITLIGALDIVWAALLVGMVMAWRRSFWRAVLFGCALAFKQSPWILTPFLLIRIVRDPDEGKNPYLKAAQFSLISGLTFVLINLPFIIADWGAWARGVVEPIRDNLVFYSQGGPSGLTQYDFIYLPKTYYLIASAAILALLLIAYWRHYSRLRNAFWLLPGIDLWFSYRNLVTYWTFWLFPTLATLTLEKPSGTRSAANDAQARVRVWPTLLAAGITLVVLVFAAVLLAGKSPLLVAVQSPILVDGSGRISALTVTVANASDSLLKPRFAVQDGHTYTNPVAWRIDSGPTSLQPGQAGLYRIAAPEDVDSFYSGSPGQVVVTDGGNQYALRGLTTIPADRSFLWPDMIANPTYTFWNDNLNGPLYWTPRSEPPETGSLAMVHKAERDALELTLNAWNGTASRMALETQIIFPTAPFTIGVYSDAASQASAASAWGIEINDGEHLMRLMFNGAGNSGDSPAQRTVNFVVPIGQWTEVTIDVAQLYAQAAWPLPAFQRTTYRGIDADFRLITLRLFVAADATHNASEPIHAYFGAIQQVPSAPEMLMADIFTDPAAYYTRIGDAQFDAANYARAIDAYQRALDFAANDPTILDKLKRATRYAEQFASH